MSEASEHRQATEAAKTMACTLCGRKGSCVPAHFPHHRGMGGRKGYWQRKHWTPLCGEMGACHDLIDGRNGVGSQRGHERWIAARQKLRETLGLDDET